MYGGYDEIDGGQSEEAMVDLTGIVIKSRKLFNSEELFYSSIIFEPKIF